jgi:hypothetical protein
VAWPVRAGLADGFLGLTFGLPGVWLASVVSLRLWKETAMDMTVTRIGAVVVAELRAADYLESTIGQYAKTIRALAQYAGQRGGVYSLGLGLSSR